MELKIYNTLTRQKEAFRPILKEHVGLYVCGPTVYGDPHLGHARPSVTFDVLFRLLVHLGYKVRYVRNITDVGHLENDADEGEDKIAKKARLDQLEPMEVAQYYINRYRDAMRQMNTLPPSIEPHASGHIIEQIEFVKVLLEKGYAYQSNGSVYFDVEKYDKQYHYGTLSGRVLDEMISASRSLDGQTDKRNPYDFALWKKASAEHIMRWPSPWSDGFPGWHLECSAMSTKYLGEQFDIHGGGMDLMFPHHECEIAQSTAVHGHGAANYWMHNNMITINGKKMGKSLENFITLEELFTGNHALLNQPYAPMVIRFFILQAQYRSTLDFSNEALSAAEKGLERLMKAVRTLDKITPSGESTVDVKMLRFDAMQALCDDLNTPVAVAVLFDWVKNINSIYDGEQTITQEDLDLLRKDIHEIVFSILGLRDDADQGDNHKLIKGLIEMTLVERGHAKANKDWVAADRIRDRLLAMGVVVKDRKDGTDWELK